MKESAEVKRIKVPLKPMAKKNEITVKDVTIKTMTINGIDYIYTTDIARQKNAVEPKDVVKNWMLQEKHLRIFRSMGETEQRQL